VQAEVDRLKKRDEDHTNKANKDRETIEKLEQENKLLHDRLQNTAGIEPPSPETPRSDIPSQQEWKCPQIDGKEYTVLGVTYKVFCGLVPHGRVVNDPWTWKDPLFLMTMCSVERNCQGIKSGHGDFFMMIDYEYPPEQEQVYPGGWSIIPTKPRTLDPGPMVPDIYSRTNDYMGGSFGHTTRCPDIDGQTLTVGDRNFQINRKKEYKPKNYTSHNSVFSFIQCLVLCAIDDKCQGLTSHEFCSLLWEHEALPKNTRQSELGSSRSWVAMVIKP
jgi:hypothetical protein